MDSVDINHLPPEMLLAIFEYLPFNDRLPTSQVSKQWQRVIETPRLWKEHTIDFERGPYYTPNFNIRYFSFLTDHISLIRHLNLKFKRMTDLASRKLLKFTDRWHLLKKDIDWNLFSISISCTNHWSNIKAHRRLVRSLKRLLGWQNAMVSFEASLLSLEATDASSIIEIVAMTSLNTINALHLNNCIATTRFQPPPITGRLISLITNFPNLKQLTLNYSFLSVELLHLLAVKYEDKFEKLILTGNGRLETDPEFQTAFIFLKQACPKLSVEYKSMAQPTGLSGIRALRY